MAVRFNDSFYLVENYYLSQLDVQLDCVDATSFGETLSAPVQERVTLCIEATSVKGISFNEGLELFRNIESYSVNELLAIAYKKNGDSLTLVPHYCSPN
jgi:hypothetical protein